jgi:hypothetical protein
VNRGTPVRSEKTADAARRVNTRPRERETLQSLIDDSANKMIAHHQALACARSRFSATYDGAAGHAIKLRKRFASASSRGWPQVFVVEVSAGR